MSHSDATEDDTIKEDASSFLVSSSVAWKQGATEEDASSSNAAEDDAMEDDIACSDATEDEAEEEDAGAASEGHHRRLCDSVEVAACRAGAETGTMRECNYCYL